MRLDADAAEIHECVKASLYRSIQRVRDISSIGSVDSDISSSHLLITVQMSQWNLNLVLLCFIVLSIQY